MSDMLGLFTQHMVHRKHTCYLQHGDTADDTGAGLMQHRRRGAEQVSQRQKQQLGCE